MNRIARQTVWVAGMALLAGCAHPREQYFHCGSATVAVSARLVPGQAVVQRPGLPDGVRAMFGPDKPGQQIVLRVRVVESQRHAIRQLGVWWGQDSLLFPSTITDKTAKLPPVNLGIGMGLGLGGGGSRRESLGSGHPPGCTCPACRGGGGGGHGIGVTPGVGLGVPLGGQQNVGTRDVEAVFQAPQFAGDLSDMLVYLELLEQQSNTMVLVQPVMLSLEVAPTVSADRRYVRIDTRPVITNIQLTNGQTVVLGGLHQEDLKEPQSKVPLLNKIPVLGHLFKSRNDGAMRRNLMLMVTPRIIIQEEEE